MAEVKTTSLNLTAAQLCRTFSASTSLQGGDIYPNAAGEITFIGFDGQPYWLGDARASLGGNPDDLGRYLNQASGAALSAWSGTNTNWLVAIPPDVANKQAMASGLQRPVSDYVKWAIANGQAAVLSDRDARQWVTENACIVMLAPGKPRVTLAGSGSASYANQSRRGSLGLGQSVPTVSLAERPSSLRQRMAEPPSYVDPSAPMRMLQLSPRPFTPESPGGSPSSRSASPMLMPGYPEIPLVTPAPMYPSPPQASRSLARSPLTASGPSGLVLVPGTSAGPVLTTVPQGYMPAGGMAIGWQPQRPVQPLGAFMTSQGVMVAGSP